MITTILKGGIGNQMFQISAALATALRDKTGFIIGSLEYPIYKEPSFNYTEIPKWDNICLDGYFQSEKYFKDYRKEILDYFGFKYSKLNKISIHVRRGDYVGNECHPVITLEYINKAVNHFKNLGYSDKDFLIFTDDKVWCRENLPYPISIGRTGREDMELMSCCEHNIIANSSFSWWGAWLNQNPDKIVIAPKIWFGGRKANLDTKDLIPEEWIKL